ncbi:hypothetical protein ATK36_2075 [Amycolatopsis sulphurea]|uniref:Uncharacterized protein n=1 Tax=Amycolatopsis sulphurea TaxID=76022 RepID=A0A2A9F7B0_9PSEU|nr:hypothetical protein [Amycolatopsis sulphurea]PFG47058.1 hypothetical protein ATK36_2075 [Amycolatopsis sulphurea]
MVTPSHRPAGISCSRLELRPAEEQLDDPRPPAEIQATLAEREAAAEAAQTEGPEVKNPTPTVDH